MLRSPTAPERSEAKRADFAYFNAIPSSLQNARPNVQITAPSGPDGGWHGWAFSAAGTLLGLLADLIRQAGDLTQAPHTVLKIGPEVHSQLPARLLQAGKRVPRLTARLAPRAAADLPLLHVVPDVPFAQVVVQRHLGPLQHPQQRRPMRRHPLEHAVDAGKAGPLRTPDRQTASPTRRSPRLGCLPIRLQILIQLPDLLPDLRDGRPVFLTVRHQPRQRPFRMEPAGRMHQDVELPRTIAEDRPTPATPHERSDSPATPLRWRSARAADDHLPLGEVPALSATSYTMIAAVTTSACLWRRGVWSGNRLADRHETAGADRGETYLRPGKRSTPSSPLSRRPSSGT